MQIFKERCFPAVTHKSKVQAGWILRLHPRNYFSKASDDRKSVILKVLNYDLLRNKNCALFIVSYTFLNKYML